MSYDVQIWSVEPVNADKAIPRLTSWSKVGGSWRLESRDWQIVIGSSDEVLPEDIPPEVSSTIPGVRYLTELTLQPIAASATAKKTLFDAAKALAKSSHGVIYDGQSEELITPAGVKRFSPAARAERFALLKLGWWFLDDSVFERPGLENLLTIFNSLLPEALPRRYGLYEPPQYQLSVNGYEHMLQFVGEHLDDSPVLYPTRPVLGLQISCPRDHHHPRFGFRSNLLSIECEATVLNQPGWQEGLRRFWLAVCSNLSPFYSEVRTVKGYVRMGPTYGSDIETEVHPVRSWFWRGFPRELGHAVAIGTPYIELFSEVTRDGHPSGELLVFDVGEWREGNNLKIDVPEGIRQVRTPEYESDRGGWSVNWVMEYPEIWPFGS